MGSMEAMVSMGMSTGIFVVVASVGWVLRDFASRTRRTVTKSSNRSEGASSAAYSSVSSKMKGAGSKCLTMEKELEYTEFDGVLASARAT